MAYSSQFPASYITANMSGQGIAGVLAGAINVIITLGFSSGGQSSSEVTVGGYIYFGLSVALILFCTIFYFFMSRTNYANAILEKASGSSKQRDFDAPIENRSFNMVEVWQVFKLLWVEAAQVWFVFFVTLSLFPSLSTTVIAPDATKYKSFFEANFALLSTFVFQIFDFVGRSLPYLSFMKFPRKWIWIPVLLRILFLPLFVVCKPQLFSSNIIGSTVAAYLTMSLFAVTNGYFGTLSMMYGPEDVPPKLQAMAGIILSLFLQTGIFMASFSQLLLSYIIANAPFLQ